MVTGHRKAENIPPGTCGALPPPIDWSLANADELNAQHPRSYFIPPAPRRRALRTGELVRLEFRYGPHADRERAGHVERMWVEVLDQRADGQAYGRLRNHPVRLRALEIGDLLAFEPEHVTSIEYTDDELGYAQDQWAIIDEAITGDDRAPDIVIRAPGPYVPDQDAWWMLVRDDPAGPTTLDVNSLTDRFPGLTEPLHAGAGLWKLASGQRGDARWRRVGQGELNSSDEWQGFLDWMHRTATRMRQPPEFGGQSARRGP
jgi:Uncharacterized protein conserved in bacteria (DUF2314)